MVKENFIVCNNIMDQNQQGPLPTIGNGTPAQAYGRNEYQTTHMIVPSHSPTQEGGHSASSSNLREQPHSHNYSFQQPQQELEQQLNYFWASQRRQIKESTNFRNHGLPLSSIKRIMKANKDVKMISTEAPKVFAKACEMFIKELTIRSWVNIEENGRRTLQKSDIATTIERTNGYDFLHDVVPKDENDMVDCDQVWAPQQQNYSSNPNE